MSYGTYIFLTSLSIISGCILVAANGILHSFLQLSTIPLCICTTPSLSIHLLTDIKLFPCLAYCKPCCFEHRGACVLLNYTFVWLYAQEWDY